MDAQGTRPLPLSLVLLFLYTLLLSIHAQLSCANFYIDFVITWGNDRAKILENGEQLQLSLDHTSGSGFQSNQEYLFAATIDMQIKLVPGNSAGTVTAYYLSSQGPNHDEIDFEFLGNLSGDPYVMHTNVFSQGRGNREQQFYLWFDPTTDFHTYSVSWTARHIIFSVDGIPVRVFKNNEGLGVPYPKKQPMRIYSSLWNAEDWATRGGLVKTDWTKAPFLASFRNFNYKPHTTPTPTPSQGQQVQTEAEAEAEAEALDSTQTQRLNWVRKNYMIYDYCADTKRFPTVPPPECTLNSKP